MSPLGWWRRRAERRRGIDEARQHLRAAHEDRPEVQELVKYLHLRQRQNHFGDMFKEALGGKR